MVLRRDRVVLPIWVTLLSALPASYAAGTRSLLPTAAEREQYARSIGTNPTFRALLGPVFGSDVGALGAWRSLFVLVIVGLASLLTVIRHTRTDEEAGRRELLGATVVGRHAPLGAALGVTFAADLALGALVALWMVAIGTPVTGALALGASWTVAGWLFAASGGLAAQLTERAGAARGIAIAALSGTYLLRAAGDASGPASGVSWLSWVSPIGWLQQVRPYAGERWWPLAAAAALTVAIGAGAFALSARRDLGAGVLAGRPGPAAAAPALRSPLALAWRLHRGLLAGWAAGFAVYGAVLGASAKGVQDMVAGSSQLADLLRRLGGAAAISDAYLAGVISVTSLGAAAYAVQATLRLRTEEAALRAEPVLATAVSRLRWAASHLAFAVAGPAVVLALLGLLAGLAYGLSVGDVSGQAPRVLAGALVQLPAVWVLTGLATALFGLLPRAAWVAWAALAGFLLVGQFGEIFKLDQKLVDVSPFTHVPKLPGAHLTVTPLAWLVAISAVLVAAGLAGLRYRDIR
nr:ABC transporter permease [Planosporangium thailandense]